MYRAGAEHAAGPTVHVPAREAEGSAWRLAGAAPDVGEQATATVAVTEPADVQPRLQTGWGAPVSAGTRPLQGWYAGLYHNILN